MRLGQAGLVIAFAFGVFAWSFSADAQQPTKVARIAILSDESLSLVPKTSEPAFADGLRDLGWVEGKNLRFFADRAAKKWPLQGSLKVGVGYL